MKNLFYFLMMVVVGFSFSSCSKDKDDDNNNNNTTLVELTGALTTRTLSANQKYLLKGQVFVNDGQTLTIEPGTVIFGDKATKGTLVINRGGRIIAEGTADKPIVFTSALAEGIRDRGDWGGLVILGRANVNQNNPAIEGITPEVNFGTTNSTANDGESSGTLKYVRVEFAGIELTPNNETNSITLGGVGRGTVMEYCQVSYGGDDGFEWFGGTVNGKYLISLGMWDDDFDMDFGYAGNVQFGLVVRYPSFADQSGSNGIEADNGPNDNDVQPYTTATLSNLTVLGPLTTATSSVNANYQHAMDLRRRVSISVANSVFAGFPRGVRFNQPSVGQNYAAGRGVLVNNVLQSGANTYQAGTGVTVDDVKAVWEATNTTIAQAAAATVFEGLGIKADLFYGTKLPEAYPSNPDFKLLAAGSLATGASFASPKFSEANRQGFFQNVAYRGAFGSATDWTDGWAEFNPILKKY
ncbi:MAG: hypothetical protein IPM26_02390 [Saprospiraceae bacterium]|nr:hypothetical protein [Saprospiraceae bacterium]